MRRIATTLLIFGATAMGPADDPKKPSEGIAEISVERTRCLGTCPVDKVVLRSDGTATYFGTDFVKRRGTYEGKIRMSDYWRLAGLLESQDFFEMRPRYAIQATDLPSVVTRAVRDGKEKAVVNYGDAGPVELWGIEMAIRGIVAEAEWKPK